MEYKLQNLTLAEVSAGTTVVIKSIDCLNNALKKHFLDMGLTPGVKVKLIKVAPLGNPLGIMVRGYELTLRKEEAAKIQVEQIKQTKRRKSQILKPSYTVHPKIGEPSPDENSKKALISGHINIALVGNPNAGKTTLFNKLTGSNYRVGNFPGVTVEEIQGTIKNHPDITITDLPGIYSLSAYSDEEIVSRNYILKQKPHGIINIVDASNIERNLYLTSQLMELDTPMVIALNMMDEVIQSGEHIDINSLELALGVPIVPISALKKEGIEELIEHAENVARSQKKPLRINWSEDKDHALIHKCISSIALQIKDAAEYNQIPLQFASTKLAEKDSVIEEILNLDDNKKEICSNLIKDMEQSCGLDCESALSDLRFSFIENLCSNFVQKPKESLSRRISTKIDKVLTGKYTAFPMFIAVLGLIFYLTFGAIGATLSDLLNEQIAIFTNYVDSLLSNYNLNPVAHSLIIDGAFAGIGSVLSFLPTIIVLFFFLSLLEDSGYMARISFIMDKILRKIGLSGSSFVPMLLGFGCSVPAILATRTLPSERDRKMTILLIPFMSCSAKLPIYAMFTAAFFKDHQTLVVISLYLLGIIIGIFFICVLKRFAFRGEPVPFIMELPNYRLPDFKTTFRLIFYKVKDFVKLAFTIIFTVSISVWFLQHFDAKLNFNSSDSLLSNIGNFITPVFQPLGINDWRISTAFISGLLAKESVISSLSILLGNTTALPSLFSKLTAFVFLVFSLLYTPCIAAIATVKRELGKRWAWGIIFAQCFIAWTVAFITYRIGLLFIS